jgi:hypothetical protein
VGGQCREVGEVGEGGRSRGWDSGEFFLSMRIGWTPREVVGGGGRLIASGSRGRGIGG